MENQTSDYMQGFYRGRAEGEIQEQERIIKLLKGFGYPEGTIAIIKGETDE